MKILMTGFTALQINSTNRSIQKIDVPASIVKALEEAGHEVDWRKVTPGEDLSSYDVAWINLAPMNSLNARQGAMGSLYVLSSGLPSVGFFDDWQFSAVFNGARAVVRNPKMLYKHLLVGAAHRGDEGATYFSRADAEAALARVMEKDPIGGKKVSIERYYMMDKDELVQPYEKRLVKAAEQLLTERWAAGMVPVCPMYGFGDRSLVRKRMPKDVGPIEALDPSPTIYDSLSTVAPADPSTKKRAWVLGALMPHDTWLDKKSLAWPVEIVGSRKMVRERGGQRFDTEQEVLEFYNQHWGIMSPPYMHAGSGWWRSRFLYAARVGSILITDKGEGDPLGDAYKVTISQVEAMNDAELAAAAKAQADALRQYMPSYSQFAEHVVRIVERAKAEDKGIKLNPDGTSA
jgi:hypothetical protein